MAHADHLAADHRDLVGPFVVDTARLGELAGLATPTLFPAGLRVSVVVPVATLRSPPPCRPSSRRPHLVLAGLEVKLDG